MENKEPIREDEQSISPTNNNTSFTTNNDQYVIESKVFKAKSLDLLLGKANKYVNERPAHFGNVQEVDNYFIMSVDILAVPIITYTNPYSPVQWPYIYGNTTCGQSWFSNGTWTV